MGGIESAQRRVEAAPAPVDPGLHPGMRHEHARGTGKTVAIDDAGYHAGRNALGASQGGEQYRVFGAVAGAGLDGLERGGITDVQAFLLDEAGNERAQAPHFLQVAVGIADHLACHIAQHRRFGLQPGGAGDVIGTRCGFPRASGSADIEDP